MLISISSVSTRLRVLLTGSTRHGAGYDIDAAGLEYLSDPIIPTAKYRLEK